MNGISKRKDEDEGRASTSSFSYPNAWLYLDHYFESDDIGDNFGFVYCITNKTNGKKYIGRKYFWSFRKPRGKSRRVRSESNWKKYYGSSDDLKKDVAKYGNDSFERRILSVHTTKGYVNYEETRQLFVNNVLTEALDNGDPAYYNNNILSRYFRKDYFHGQADSKTK